MCCNYSFYVYLWILTFLIAELVICQARLEGGWNSSPNTQYHIQTDEGEERYFRYQTLTGQYRKEKRLQDGSVVGTYGWVDADGYLRLKDYVADEQGYRIVRSKKLYVGGNTPADQTVYPSKYVPTQVVPNPEYNAYANVVDNSISTPTPTTTLTPPTVQQYNAHSQDYRTPSHDSSVTTTAVPYYHPVTDNTISSTAVPYSSNHIDDYLISKSNSYSEKRLEFPSSETSPISLSDYLKLGSEQVEREVAITPHYRYSISTTPTPPRPVYETSNPVPVYETSTSAPRPVTFRPYYNPNVVLPEFNIQDGSKKASEYDGVSLTHDGFKYYLPKQYHEEEGTSSSYRAGSFGYVDPFGIRRVIYYNTSPEKGFVHRKNNRYVGFDAAPYDPRI